MKYRDRFFVLIDEDLRKEPTMNDASIIQLFLDRNEEAIHEVDLKYGKLCLHLANNILMSKEDAEECVADTYLKIWWYIPCDCPDNLTAYLCKIIKRSALDKLRYKNAQKRSNEASVSLDELSEILSDPQNPEDDFVIRDLSEAINNFGLYDWNLINLWMYSDIINQFDCTIE